MYHREHEMESISPDNAAEVRTIRKWFLVALVLSLAIHVGIYALLRTKQLDRSLFSAPTERLVPRAFTVKKVVINEELLKPAATPDPKRVEPPKTVLQNEKPSSDQIPTDVRLTPNAPPASDITKAIAAEKPRVEASKINSPEANAQIDKEIDSLHEQIASKNAPKIMAGQGTALPESHRGEQGYSNLDDLLKKSGPLTGNVAPVNMPGGALFEFDSAVLKPEATKTLSNLGTLIRLNPRATFRIEGYTDSFGKSEYNLKLSTARAEAMKAWLLANMKLDPARIQTKGFGSDRLITPATGTREEQKVNRRVEIVIITPKQ